MRDVAEAHVAGLEKLAAPRISATVKASTPWTETSWPPVSRTAASSCSTFAPSASSPLDTSRHAIGADQGELHKRLKALPSDAEVVAYCRGPYCVYADDAVRQLAKRGFKAARLQDGFPEWQRAGLPVASGA